MGDTEVSVSEVKARLAEYIRRAEADETTTITANGRPVAQLGPAGGVKLPMPGNGVWALVEENVSSYPPYPFTPKGFVDKHAGNGEPTSHLRDLIAGEVQGWVADPGLRKVVDWWGESADRGREFAVLWRHLTASAAVLAVPTGYWRDGGGYRFFHTAGAGTPITPLYAWDSHVAGWSAGDVSGFHTAAASARAVGSRLLGLGA